MCLWRRHMNKIVKMKIKSMQEELFGNVLEEIITERENCTDEENAQYKKLQSGDYPKPLPEGVFKDKENPEIYYRKKKVVIQLDAPSEEEINKLLVYTQAHHQKATTEHLRKIRTLLAWTVFWATFSPACVLCCAAFISLMSQNTMLGIVSIISAVVMFFLSGKALGFCPSNED